RIPGARPALPAGPGQADGGSCAAARRPGRGEPAHGRTEVRRRGLGQRVRPPEGRAFSLILPRMSQMRLDAAALCRRSPRRPAGKALVALVPVAAITIAVACGPSTGEILPDCEHPDNGHVDSLGYPDPCHCEDCAAFVGIRGFAACASTGLDA